MNKSRNRLIRGMRPGHPDAPDWSDDVNTNKPPLHCERNARGIPRAWDIARMRPTARDACLLANGNWRTSFGAGESCDKPLVDLSQASPVLFFDNLINSCRVLTALHRSLALWSALDAGHCARHAGGGTYFVEHCSMQLFFNSGLSAQGSRRRAYPAGVKVVIRVISSGG